MELRTRKSEGDLRPCSIAASCPRPQCPRVCAADSALISFLYVNSSTVASKDDFRQTTLAELRRLPIPEYDADDPRHQRLAKLASDLLAMPPKLKGARMHHERAVLERQVDALDRAVDELVCDLYGLTDEETAVIMAFRK